MISSYRELETLLVLGRLPNLITWTTSHRETPKTSARGPAESGFPEALGCGRARDVPAPCEVAPLTLVSFWTVNIS